MSAERGPNRNPDRKDESDLWSQPGRATPFDDRRTAQQRIAPSVGRTALDGAERAQRQDQQQRVAQHAGERAVDGAQRSARAPVPERQPPPDRQAPPGQRTRDRDTSREERGR